MKIVVAMMKHETNTFSPVPTALGRFGPDGPYRGRAAYEAFHGTGTPMNAFLDLAEEEGAEIDTPIAAEAYPSGVVHADAYRTLTDAICEASSGRDGDRILLHGSSRGRMMRALASGVPVCVTVTLLDGLVRARSAFHHPVHCRSETGRPVPDHLAAYARRR